MNLEEVLNYRCFMRVYDKIKPIDTERVKTLFGTGNTGSQQFEYAGMGILPHHAT